MAESRVAHTPSAPRGSQVSEPSPARNLHLCSLSYKLGPMHHTPKVKGGRHPTSAGGSRSIEGRPRDGQTLMDHVVARLEERIVGEFEVGESLPAQADLARSLGVSRITVREATRNLEARGLLHVANGRRPVVTAPSATVVTDYFHGALRQDPRAFFDLIELRRALEVHVANAAANRAPEVSIDQMEGLLREMREAADPYEFNDADNGFHMALASSIGNRLVASILQELMGLMRESGRRSFAGHLARGGTAADIVKVHTAILDEIKQHHAQGAAAAMRLHFREAERDLKRSEAGLDTSIAPMPDR